MRSDVTVSEAVEIPRDQWGRPLIIPLGGGDPVPYTRASTLAKALDDQSNLMAWKQRKTAEGLVRRPDLVTRVAGALANGDPDTHWPTKKVLNAICREATEAAGASSGASSGTGLHALTEAIDSGREPEFVPEHARPRLEAYRKAMAPYVVHDVETFVVNDTIRAAGTFDRLLLCPDGYIRVADLKSGKSEADYPLAVAMQIAIYVLGRRYQPANGARLDLCEFDPDRLDVTTGLLIHLPPSGGCRVHELNLTRGWDAAQVAARVHHDIRKWVAADIIRWSQP
jgi:hypothetical protein